MGMTAGGNSPRSPPPAGMPLPACNGSEPAWCMRQRPIANSLALKR